VENDISDLCARGVRCLAVARTDPLGEWVFLGLLTFLDPPRPDTLQTILDSKKYGVAVKMITGTRLFVCNRCSFHAAESRIYPSRTVCSPRPLVAI
jgi:cation transport ATPase